jgi:diguanylate cyclase (GGDEF)-like protein/PAS domain S-box-containing protein
MENPESIEGQRRRRRGWLTQRFDLLFPFGVAAVVTLLAALAILQLDDLRREQARMAERAQVKEDLDVVRIRLEKELVAPLLETHAIAAQIIAQGDISREDFQREASFLTAGQRNVHNLAVSRGTVIAMAYPETGKPPILGLDYRKTPVKWPAVEKAIQSHQPILDGPEEMVQGGQGLVLRDPVYRTDPVTGKESFYGLVSMVLDLPNTFAAAQLDRADLPLRIVLCTGGKSMEDQKLIFGDARIWDHNPVVADVSMPYAAWRIAAEPRNGWRNSESLFSPARIVGLCVFLLIGIISFGTAVFIVQREAADRILRASQRVAARDASHIRALLEQASDGIHILDRHGKVIEVSNSFCQMLGYGKEELLGLHPKDWDASFNLEDLEEMIETGFHGQGRNRFETRHRRKDGTVFDVEITTCRMVSDGAVYFFNSARDITERKNAERQINQLAFFDQLTGLPNRTLLLDRLKTAIAASGRSGKCGALLFIDLDDFKTLNDTLGHSMGDLLLKKVGERLQRCVRGEDTVARLGGDEFLVMAPNLGNNENVAAFEAELLAERVRTALNEHYPLETVTYRCTPSIGVTIFHGQGSSIADPLKQADMAMYKAKGAGRNAIRFFDPGMEIAVRERAALEADLRDAIAQEQFILHYQVQVDGLERPIGAECLVRWLHPQRGVVSPAEFIPLAEETGLILPLGHWVLRQACKQLALWASLPSMSELSLAVNVSIRQFRQADFVDVVIAAIHEADANPRLLKLELTESLLVENVAEAVEKMVALKSLGVCFSLDDFGTGYSSLAYLKRLPLDQLKIDQSFVRDALVDPNDAALARTVIALGQSLALGVIAEGVESHEQRDFLLRSGCNFFQGYLYGRPLPVDAFVNFVLEMRGR